MDAAGRRQDRRVAGGGRGRRTAVPAVPDRGDAGRARAWTEERITIS